MLNLFPLQAVYLSLFIFVNIWTISIHDGDYRIPDPLICLINGAAHHVDHHLFFNYNYGQYFTLWDRLGGSYRHPSALLGKGPHDHIRKLLAEAAQTQWMENSNRTLLLKRKCFLTETSVLNNGVRDNPIRGKLREQKKEDGHMEVTKDVKLQIILKGWNNTLTKTPLTKTVHSTLCGKLLARLHEFFSDLRHCHPSVTFIL